MFRLVFGKKFSCFEKILNIVKFQCLPLCNNSPIFLVYELHFCN